MSQPDDPGIFGGDDITEIDIGPMVIWGAFGFGVFLTLLVGAVLVMLF